MRRVNGLVCAEANARIEPYLDGDLEPARAAELEHHAARCEPCAAELELARRVGEGLRSLPLVACPPGVAERALERARREAERPSLGQSFGRRLRRWLGLDRHLGGGLVKASAWRPALAGGVAALALATAFGVVLRQPETSPVPAAQQAEVAQAEREARLALAYLGAISRRASLTLRDDVLRPHVVEAPQQAFALLAENRRGTNPPGGSS